VCLCVCLPVFCAMSGSGERAQVSMPVSLQHMRHVEGSREPRAHKRQKDTEASPPIALEEFESLIGPPEADGIEIEEPVRGVAEQGAWHKAHISVSRQAEVEQTHVARELCENKKFNLSSPVGIYELIAFLRQQGIKLFFRIPDIVLISAGTLCTWLFTSKSGEVLRKSPMKLNAAAVETCFKKEVDRHENFENIAAVVLDEPVHLLSSKGFGTVVDLMKEAELKGTLPNTPTILQKYIKPRDDIGWETHAVRDGDNFLVCHRTFRYSDRYSMSRSRFGPLANVVHVFPPIPASLVKEITRLTIAMLRSLWRAHTSIDLVRCEFIKDSGGRLILHRIATDLSPGVELPDSVKNGTTYL